MDLTITVTAAEAKSLEKYRKFLNRTRGTDYATVDDMVTHFIRHRIRHVHDEVEKRINDKLNAAMNQLTPAEKLAALQALKVQDTEI